MARPSVAATRFLWPTSETRATHRPVTAVLFYAVSTHSILKLNQFFTHYRQSCDVARAYGEWFVGSDPSVSDKNGTSPMLTAADSPCQTLLPPIPARRAMDLHQSSATQNRAHQSEFRAPAVAAFGSVFERRRWNWPLPAL